MQSNKEMQKIKLSVGSRMCTPNLSTKYFFFLLKPFLFAVPVTRAIHNMRPSEQLGLPIHFPTQLTFYIVVAFNMFNKMNFSIFDFIFICTFSEKCLATVHQSSLHVLIWHFCTLNLGLQIILVSILILTQLTAY